MSRDTTIIDVGNGISPLDVRETNPIPALRSAVDAIFPTRKRHIEEPSPTQLFNLEDTSVARKHRRIERPNVGERIPAVGSPIDGFRTGLARTPYLHTPITVPQRIVNQKKPYTRLVQRGVTGMPVLDTITKYKFAFLKRTPLETRQDAWSQTLREVLAVPIEDGTIMQVDMRLMVLFEPAVLNYYLYMAQRVLYERDPEAFYDLTAADIMNEWSFDGLVISEEMLNGAEAARSSGLAWRGKWLGGEGVKVATVTMAGEDLCANVFGGQVMHGSALYFVVKKFVVDEGGFKFNLNSKADMAGVVMVGHGDPSFETTMAARIRAMSGLDPRRNVGANAAGSRGFRPWLIQFISQPDDQPLALEHVGFVDEHGVRRFDAFQQHIGTVIIAPQGHEPMPHVLDHITLPDTGDLVNPPDLLVDTPGGRFSSEASFRRPGVAVDAAEGLQSPFIKVYLNPRGNNPL